MSVESRNSTPLHHKVLQSKNNSNTEGAEERSNYAESIRKLSIFIGIGNNGGEVTWTNGII